MYKTSNGNKGSFIYGTGLLDKLYDFTIYFWGYNFMRVIFARDDTNGGSGFYINDYSIGFGGGPDISRRFYNNTTSNKWVFYEITFKRSGSNYIVTGFYQGVKKFTVTVSSGYINHTKFFIGTWSYPSGYWDNGMYGYVYDFSIYDEILHTENYDKFPTREMDPTTVLYYKGMQNENNLYGMI